jgi:hypothetical protein
MFDRSACLFAAVALIAYAAQAQPAKALTFSHEIAPILYGNCIRCGNPAGRDRFPV